MSSAIYYKLTSCCDGTIWNLKYATGPINLIWTDGTYLYTGPDIDLTSDAGALETLLRGQCFSIEILSDTPAVVALMDSLPSTNLFEYVKPLCTDKNPIFNGISSDLAICPDCPTPCYLLIACDGDTMYTISDLSAYENTFININDSSKCWFVAARPDECGKIKTTVTVVGPCTDCECECYDIIGKGSVSYVGCDNVYHTGVTIPARFCAITTPTFDPFSAGSITTSSSCVDGVCPDSCYRLTECETGIILNSTSQNLFEHIGSVVNIEGQQGCYTVSVETEKCDCPIDVIIKASFATCLDCIPTIAYKLTSCDNPDEIVYTSQDLSEYKNKVVELEEPCGCYIVEEINIKPPSETLVTVVAGFDTCKECETKYYKLTSCNPEDPITYTSSDLALQVGKIIQIQGCDKCFIVEETRVPVNPVSIVLHFAYSDCAECLKDFPCRCSTIYNETDVDSIFEYIDCSGDIIETEIVKSKQRSERHCVIRWVTGTKPLYHGNCTEELDPVGKRMVWTCPSQAYPVKKIKPGYNTPACSIEKYEKISCNFAEQYYKYVVEQRYGVSSCCPEEINKWTVKKELIELKALIDPDYPCTPGGCGCCEDTTDCNCKSCS